MIWYATNIFHLHQEFAKLLYRKWFRINFVHSWAYCFLDIFILHMSSYGHNLGLLRPLNILCQEHLPDSLCGFISIQKRHIAVHENKRESIWILLIKRLLYFIYSFLTIVSVICELTAILHSQDHEEALYDVAVELLVIHDEDAADAQVWGRNDGLEGVLVQELLRGNA